MGFTHGSEHISETTGWILFIQSSMSLFQQVVVQHHGHFSMWPIWAHPWLPIWLTSACPWARMHHYGDIIMSSIESQITSLTIVYSTVYSGTDQRKRQSSASLAFVRGIHRWPVNSLRKGPVTRKMFPFDDVIMISLKPLNGLFLSSVDCSHL